jgi:TPR repeat protein/Zn-dependent protease
VILGSPNPTPENPIPPSNSAAGDTSEYGSILREMDCIQGAQPNRAAVFALLLLTLIAYLVQKNASGAWASTDILILIAVLFVHELGHLFAMRFFGYRNLRMFFIPFLGAAVSGNHYNVAGWKRTIVSLAGPVPGILLGVAIGLFGAAHGDRLLCRVAQLAILINGFNLLPILPLDGGWILQWLLFSRAYVLEILFRIVAAIALISFGIVRQNGIFTGLGIAMIIALPRSLRSARIAEQLRLEGVSLASPNSQDIPPEFAHAIIDKLRGTGSGRMNAKALAQQTLDIFQRLNATPPSFLPTIGLIGVQTSLLLVAVVVWQGIPAFPSLAAISSGARLTLSTAWPMSDLIARADRGDVIAMDLIGEKYSFGIGVAKDPSQALIWYRKSAEGGDIIAMNNLGYSLAAGLDGQVDFRQAMDWFRRSEQTGNASAMNGIGQMYMLGHGVNPDYTEAMSWFRKSADLGNDHAMFHIGLLYEMGEGVTADPSQAKDWYQKAAAAGNTAAKRHLLNLQ